jgi:hypothetical protein
MTDVGERLRVINTEKQGMRETVEEYKETGLTTEQALAALVLVGFSGVLVDKLTIPAGKIGEGKINQSSELVMDEIMSDQTAVKEGMKSMGLEIVELRKIKEGEVFLGFSGYSFMSIPGQDAYSPGASLARMGKKKGDWGKVEFLSERLVFDWERKGNSRRQVIGLAEQLKSQEAGIAVGEMSKTASFDVGGEWAIKIPDSLGDYLS